MIQQSKIIGCFAIILILLFFVGCAAKPTVIGHWKAIEVPQDYIDRGVQIITIDINEDNTFAVSMFSSRNDRLNGFGGGWTYMDKNKIEFEMSEPPYTKGTGELLPDGRLMTIGGAYTIYNQRVSQ